MTETALGYFSICNLRRLYYVETHMYVANQLKNCKLLSPCEEIKRMT